MVKPGWFRHNYSLVLLNGQQTTRLKSSAGLIDSNHAHLLCGTHQMETNDETPIVSVADIFEKCIGCKWTMHVLTQIRAGIHRPGQLQRTADGLTNKVLNDRLSKLVKLRIVERESFPEIPPRVEYRLTDFGDHFVQIFDQIDELQRKFSHDRPTDTGAENDSK